jgi:hypothetical protein
MNNWHCITNRNNFNQKFGCHFCVSLFMCYSRIANKQHLIEFPFWQIKIWRCGPWIGMSDSGRL